MMKFDWDSNKAKSNVVKHGVTFEEAETVFIDINAVFIYDDANSGDEDRFLVVGEDMHFRELTVCHCYRGEDEEIIWIISARKATKSERELYYQGGS